MDKTKRDKIKKKVVGIPESKNYADMVHNNLDAFSLLGQSKTYDEITYKGLDIRLMVKTELSRLGINTTNTPAVLSKIQGIHFTSYNDLVNLIEDAYLTSTRSGNRELNIIIDGALSEIADISTKLSTNGSRLTPRDFIALTQYRQIKTNNTPISELLTTRKIEKLGLNLARDAVAYDLNNRYQAVYDWSSVAFYQYQNSLIMPLKNFYTKKWLIEENETFSGYKIFLDYLNEQKYVLQAGENIVFEEQPVLLQKNKITIANNSLSKLEQSLLIMHEITKKAVLKNSGLSNDKHLKQFLKQRKYVGRKYESIYKDFKKMDSWRSMEFNSILNDCIATLATINFARIYIDGETFKKVEENLTMQASMKLASLPRTHSKWVLPYVADRVLTLSKEQYYNAGLSDSQIKELYLKTGRDVNSLETIDEVIFAKLNPSYEYTKPIKDEKEVRSGVSEKEAEDVLISKMIKKHREQSEQQETTNTKKHSKTKETKEQATETPKEEPKKEETKGENFVFSNIDEAKARLRHFLYQNLTMAGSVSKIDAMRYSIKYIQELNDKKTDMQKVSDIVYNKIIEDMNKGGSDYRRKKDNQYYIDGWRLFNGYFKSTKSSLTPDTLLKQMIETAVKEVTNEKTDTR